MGQKVSPIGLRLGVNKTWQSRWYADYRDYADLVLEDVKIRKLVMDLPECKNADIAEIEIVRHPQRVTIVIHTARPGVIIGVKGATIEKISADIQSQLTKKVQIKIKEVKTKFPSFINIFHNFLFLVALHFHCCVWAFSRCSKQGALFM